MIQRYESGLKFLLTVLLFGSVSVLAADELPAPKPELAAPPVEQCMVPAVTRAAAGAGVATAFRARLAEWYQLAHTSIKARCGETAAEFFSWEGLGIVAGIVAVALLLRSAARTDRANRAAREEHEIRCGLRPGPLAVISPEERARQTAAREEEYAAHVARLRDVHGLDLDALSRGDTEQVWRRRPVTVASYARDAELIELMKDPREVQMVFAIAVKRHKGADEASWPMYADQCMQSFVESLVRFRGAPLRQADTELRHSPLDGVTFAWLARAAANLEKFAVSSTRAGHEHLIEIGQCRLVEKLKSLRLGADDGTLYKCARELLCSPEDARLIAIALAQALLVTVAVYRKDTVDLDAANTFVSVALKRALRVKFDSDAEYGAVFADLQGAPVP